jgi:phage shock protein A
MGYTLQMSGEMHDWLTDLRDSDPPAARRVGEALTALMSEGASLGPPLVIPAADVTRQPDLAEVLDWSHQLGLARMQAGRLRVADAATTAERLRRQIAELEALQARLDDQHQRALDAGQQALAGQVADEQTAAQGQLAESRQRLAEVSQTKRRVTEDSRREIQQVEAFRTRKEVLKARYVAAQAEAAVPEAFAAGPGAGDDGQPDEEVGGPAARLGEIEEEIERELASVPWAEGAGDLRPQTGLMQLRPGAPGDDDIRILFAVEPPGTAFLLAVLEGLDALRDHYDEAVSLSSEVLRGVRAGQRSEETMYRFADPQSFLDEFFAGGASDVEAGAGTLAAGNRARTLAELRDRLGLTRGEVADRMGVRPERVAAIERAEPGATEVRTLAGYVEALGGRLEIIADVGGERVVLR